MSATGTPALAGAARAARIPAAWPGRLLGLELRRNAMAWMVPLLVALFWLLTYRQCMALPALWSVRTGPFQHDHALPEFAPFAAGVSAWMGSRDGRRGTTDLVAATARPRWTGLLTAWAATTAWALLAYLACVGVLYAITAAQVSWGSAPLWPAAVGAAGVVAFCALGFAAGAVLPGWFTAPLAAVLTFLVLVAGQVALQHNSTYALLSLISSQAYATPDSGNFYHYLPDLPIAQIMLLGGLAAAALAGLGLPAAAGGAGVRRAAALIMLAGLAAAGTSCYLAGTAQVTDEGVIIPALHDASASQPIRYTPVCGRSAAIPVCIHPAYRAYLPEVTAALQPILSQVRGLPGAPAGVAQSATYIRSLPGNSGQQPPTSGMGTLTGTPPELDIPLGSDQPGQVPASDFTSQVRTDATVVIVDTLIEPQPGTTQGPAHDSPAQQAVAAAIFAAAGVPQQALPQTPLPGTVAYTASQRFAALPAATRHHWLATHLTALKNGQITLAELP
jgi:hypothetical protein